MKSRRYNKHRSTQDGVDYLAYARIRNQALWECKKANNEFERSLAKEAKRNPKAVLAMLTVECKLDQELQTYRQKAQL